MNFETSDTTCACGHTVPGARVLYGLSAVTRCPKCNAWLDLITTKDAPPKPDDNRVLNGLCCGCNAKVTKSHIDPDKLYHQWLCGSCRAELEALPERHKITFDRLKWQVSRLESTIRYLEAYASILKGFIVQNGLNPNMADDSCFAVWKYHLRDEFLKLLNEAVALDNTAIKSLINARVSCNDQLAAHKTIQVADTPTGPAVGMLGVINGLCEQLTGQRIAAYYTTDGVLNYFIACRESEAGMTLLP